MLGTHDRAIRSNSACSTPMASTSEDPWPESPRLSPQVSSIMFEAAPLTVAEISLGAFPRGAALILCDATDFEEVGEPMNSLAEHGYESLAANLSGRPDWARGDGAIETLLDRLAQRGWELQQIGVIGYGWGAQLALGAAATHQLGAAVSVASPPTPAQAPHVARALASLRTPWLGLTSVPSTASVADVLGRLDHVRALQCRVYTEVVCYPQVPQRFYRNTAETLLHAAAFDSWQRTLEWLNGRVMPRLTPASLAWRSGLPAACGAP
jgi:carboxymethylenebutenolidase